MQFWMICTLFFIAGFFLMGVFVDFKKKQQIRIAVFDKETGTKKVVTIDKGFNDEIDSLIAKLKQKQKKGAK